MTQQRESILSADFFHKMAEHTDKVYKFVKLYNDYVNMPRDYGNGRKINMLGIHIMSAIEEHPGITVSQLAQEWLRTKGSISQVLKNLEESGYIIKKRSGKNICLYPTAAGIELSLYHKLYDAQKFKARMEFFMQTCTEADLDSFYKVLERYTQLLMNNQEES